MTMWLVPQRIVVRLSNDVEIVTHEGSGEPNAASFAHLFEPPSQPPEPRSAVTPPAIDPRTST
jgi:hypothetical protein